MPDAPTPPVPVSATFATGPQVLTLVFSSPLDPASTVGAGQLRITSPEGTFPGFDGLAVVGDTLTLEFGIPGLITEPATVAYVAGAGTLVGANGLPVAPFSGFDLTLI